MLEKYLPRFTVKNYAEMLTNIMYGSFLYNIAIIYVYGDALIKSSSIVLPAVMLGHIDLGPLKIPVPIYVFVFAGAVAVFARLIKLHDIISHGFKIRFNFDMFKIIFPMMHMVGRQPRYIGDYFEHRNRIMQNIFYKYASSAKSSTLVDRHDIERALTRWSYFWILIEVMFFTIFYGFIFLLFDIDTNIMFLILSISLILCIFIYNGCESNVRKQYEQICEDMPTVKEIKEFIDALSR